MKQKLLFLTMILCLIFSVPAWADNIAGADAASAAQAIAISGQGGAVENNIGIGVSVNPVAYGGNARAMTGPSSAIIGDITSTVGDTTSVSGVGNVSSGSNSKVGDTSATIGNVQTGPSSASVEGVEGGSSSLNLQQTFEAAEIPDLWKTKGNGVLPGIASPNLMQQFVGGGVPLSVRQDMVFQEMMKLFPVEYTTVDVSVQKKSSISSKRFKKKHWWSRSSEPKIPPVSFETEVKADHGEITVAIHPWYRNYLNGTEWANLTGEVIHPKDIRVNSVRIVNTTLAGHFAPLGVIAIASNPGESSLMLTDDVALYVQEYFKGVAKVILFDPKGGSGFVSGSEANSKGGGISTAIANFATFNTLTGGASLGGSSGTVMPVSVFGKCFMAMAPADSIGIKGTEIKITNTPPKKAETVDDNGNGKKAVGSGVVK